MFNDLLTLTAKAGLLCTLSVTSLIVGTGFLDGVDDPTWRGVIVGVREIGSVLFLGLFMAVVLFVFIKVVPLILGYFLQSIRQLTDELKEMRLSRERHDAAERLARAQSIIDFREMLWEHSNDVSKHIDSQTKQIESSFKVQTAVLQGIKNLAVEASEEK